MKNVGMASTLGAILMQSSRSIYEVAARKVKSFISGRILECKVSGRIAASLAKCVVRVRPERGLEIFFPYICDQILGELAICVPDVHLGRRNNIYSLRTCPQA